ncbi:MAG: hypothetical protein ACI9D0_000293 [Bacteroidia bacterium]|jgi:hypothetical protein
MLNCKEIKRRDASDEVADTGFLMRLQGSIHVAICTGGRNYRRQLQQIRQRARTQADRDTDEETVARVQSTIL